MPSLAETREMVRLRRRVSPRRPRRRRRGRLPAQQVPRGITAEYARRLRKIVAFLREELQPLMRELPDLLRSARAERRQDVGEGRRIRQHVEEALRRTRARFNVTEIEGLAEEFAERTSTFQRRQLGRQVRAALGVDVLAGDPALRTLVEGFVSENVALIRGIPERIAQDVEQTLTRAITSGQLRSEIAGELNRKFAIGRRRASLIARDQIGKFHGQLNAARQQNIGVRRFVWRTVGDERVRPVHEDLEGQTFAFSDPPSEGLPGEPINCRCFAEPVFDDILEGL